MASPLREDDVIAGWMGSLNFNVHTLDSVARTLRPLSPAGGWGSRINLDGAMSISSGEETYSYTQLFRNGAIESVMPIQNAPVALAWPDVVLQALTADHHEELKGAHAKLGIDGPLFVMLRRHLLRARMPMIERLPVSGPGLYTSHVYRCKSTTRAGLLGFCKRFGACVMCVV